MELNAMNVSVVDKVGLIQSSLGAGEGLSYLPSG